MVTYIDGIKLELNETVEFYIGTIPEYREFIDKTYRIFLDLYNHPDYGMDTLIRITPAFFESIQKQCAKMAVAMLSSEKIYNVTEDEFLENHYYEYADYESVLSPVLEAYCQIQGVQESYAKYRRMQHENRSKWSGGGFGIKGAIKGAITASVMNATVDYFRDISETKNIRNDQMQIRKMKSKLYHDEAITQYYHQAIQDMYFNSLDCVVSEFIENGRLEKPLIEEKKIIGIFQNIVRYENDPKEKLKGILGCIEQYPFRGMFYEEAAKYTSDPELFELAKYCGIKVIEEEPDIPSKEKVETKTGNNESDMDNTHSTTSSTKGCNSESGTIEEEDDEYDYSGTTGHEDDSEFGGVKAVIDIILLILFFMYIAGWFDWLVD